MLSSFPFALNSVLAQTLIPHLSPVSFAALCVASKGFYYHMRQIGTSFHTFTRKRLETALSQALPAQIARIIMYACTSAATHFFTGGFLLSVLQGDPIDPESDIDLLREEQYEEEDTLIQFLSSQRLILDQDEQPPPEQEHILYNRKYFVATYNSYTRDGNKKIQIIYVKRCHISDYVAAFDFPVCRNFYAHGVTKVFHMESLVKRSFGVDIDESYLYCTHLIDTDDILYHLGPAALARMVKYKKSRGYKIILYRNGNPYELLDKLLQRVEWILQPSGVEHLDNAAFQLIKNLMYLEAAKSWIYFWNEKGSRI